MKRNNFFCTPSRKGSLLAVAFLALLLAVCPTQTRANTIALSFDNPDTAARLSGSDDTGGWAFSLSSPVLLSDLGVFDSNNVATFGPTGDGLLESHLVTIWDGSGNKVAQAMVPDGNSGRLIDGLRYVTLLNPIPLLAGDYTIGAYYQSFPDRSALAATGIATAPGIIYTGTRFEFGDNFPSGDPFGFFKNGIFGPNFQYLPNEVTDSGSSLLLLFGSLAAVVVIRRLLPGSVS